MHRNVNIYNGMIIYNGGTPCSKLLEPLAVWGKAISRYRRFLSKYQLSQGCTPRSREKTSLSGHGRKCHGWLEYKTSKSSSLWLKLWLGLMSLLTVKYLLLMAFPGRALWGGKARFALPQSRKYLSFIGSLVFACGMERREGQWHWAARVCWFHSAHRTSSPEKWCSCALPPPTARENRWKAMKHTIT